MVPMRFLLFMRSFWLKFLAFCPLLISFFNMAAYNFLRREFSWSIVVGLSFLDLRPPGDEPREVPREAPFEDVAALCDLGGFLL